MPDTQPVSSSARPASRGGLFQALRPLAILAGLGLPAAAEAASGPSATTAVVARIDIATQRMTVSVNGIPSYTWKVSTARRGYVTPSGAYRPERMHRTYFSRKYYNSPMPYSIFFRGGYAIHGSYATGQLGSPASHGCVRLAPPNAATLFSLVQDYGAENTVIIITR